MDNVADFAYSTVKTAPSPSTTGTSLVLQTGDGARFPSGSFNATAWPAGQIPLISNAEIVRCTISGDTITMTRHQEGTSAQPIAIGYQFAAGITANTIAQILAACDVAGAAATAQTAAQAFATAADVTVLSTAEAFATSAASTAQAAAIAVANANVPSGVMLDYGGLSAPAGFLLCDGSAVSRTTFATLFGVVSTRYGIGDGSTTFNLPDSRGRTPFGAGTIGSVTISVGTGAGSNVAMLSHTHTGPSHQHGSSALSIGTGAANVSDSGHGHSTYTSVGESGSDFALSAGSGGFRWAGTFGGNAQVSDSGHGHGISGATDANGTGASGGPSISTTGNSLPPYYGVSKIIKT